MEQATTTTVQTQERSAPAEGLWSAIVELTKPGITKLVVITAAVGFVIGVQQYGIAGVGLWQIVIAAIGGIAGTVLSASGANALNQWWERERDARMPRTCFRPLPVGRISPGGALFIGLALSVAGVGVLVATCGLSPALISAVTILSYVLVYTPMKTVTSLSTVVGAIPGALPPMIGWTTAAAIAAPERWAWDAGLAQTGGWSIFLLMVVWQVPHFLAIAWMYRDDYAKGGFRMLPLDDADGSRTARVIVTWSLLQVPVSLGPALAIPGQFGLIYVLAAIATGVWFVWLSLQLARERTRAAARKVFFASIIYLPVVLCALVADGLIGSL